MIPNRNEENGRHAAAKVSMNLLSVMIQLFLLLLQFLPRMLNYQSMDKIRVSMPALLHLRVLLRLRLLPLLLRQLRRLFASPIQRSSLIHRRRALPQLRSKLPFEDIWYTNSSNCSSFLIINIIILYWLCQVSKNVYIICFWKFFARLITSSVVVVVLTNSVIYKIFFIKVYFLYLHTF